LPTIHGRRRAATVGPLAHRVGSIAPRWTIPVASCWHDVERPLRAEPSPTAAVSSRPNSMRITPMRTSIGRMVAPVRLARSRSIQRCRSTGGRGRNQDSFITDATVNERTQDWQPNRAANAVLIPETLAYGSRPTSVAET
jgi:hypothetical protein